jgi:hypothetical protein
MHSIFNYLEYFNMYDVNSLECNSKLTTKVLEIPEILELIAQYLNISNTYLLLKINKATYSNDLIKRNIENKITTVYNTFRQWKKIRILKYFKGTFLPGNLIKLFPILNFKHSFIGGSSYIDHINVKDMKQPIMIGVDRYNRPYITIKYQYFPNDNKVRYSSSGMLVDLYKSITNNMGYITLFQRYTDNKDNWVKCNYYGPLLNGSGCILLENMDKKMLIKNIVRLLLGKNIKTYISKYDNETGQEEVVQEIKCKIQKVSDEINIS